MNRAITPRISRAFPSGLRFVISTGLATLIAFPARACDDDDDPYVLPPFDVNVTCSTYFDGNCTWRQCSDGSNEMLGCQINPEPPPPLPPPENGGGGGGGGGGSGGTDPDDCGPNRFTARDGNARRQIAELRVAGAVVKGGLVWSRHHNTVPRDGKEYFGYSGGWRHNWQYDLLERVQQGQPRPSYTFVGPTGVRRVFAPDSAGGWSSALSFGETLEKTSDGFDLTTSESIKLHFVQFKKANGYNDYRMEVMTDEHGLQTHLTYNLQGLLTQVVEPGGRSLTITYKDIPYDTGRFDLQVGTIPHAPAEGQWIDLPLPAELRGKVYQDFCLFGEKEGKLAVAEMQFFAANSPTPLQGVATGTGDNPSAAFDGSTNVGFRGNRDLGNVLAFRLNQPAIIDHVRVLATVGQEASLLGAWLQAYRTTSTARTAVAKVTGSDGSSVEYDYQAKLYSWQIGPSSSTVELRGARYADGSKATYQYALSGSDRKPLLVEADDPRYEGSAKRIRYSYHDRLGMIHQEINPETNHAYATLELDAKDPAKRTVTYSDFRQVSYTLSSQAHGRPIERKDSLGRVTRYEYADNGAGLLSAEVDHQGTRKEYSYNRRGRMLSSKVRGKTRADIRDGVGRVGKSIDQNGGETVFTRDEKGRIIKVLNPDGTTREFGYDSLGHQIFFREVDGRAQSFTYDSRGLKTAWKNAKGEVTTYRYDSRDRLKSITDTLGQQTSFERNDMGLVTKVVRPDGLTEQYVYDNYGRKITQIDPLGRISRFSYDPLGRVVQEIDDKGGVTRYDYTELPNGCSSCTLVSNPSSVIYPDGRITKNLYDGDGRLVSRTENIGTSCQATSTYTYDDQNNLIAVEDPLERITRYSYDGEGHLLSTIDPAGKATVFTYDKRGNLASATEPGGGVTHHTYDANDRRIKTVDAVGNVTRFGYDVLGNLTMVKDAAGAITRFTYEGKKLTATDYADGKRETSVYDSLGRIIKSTSRDGVVTTTVYDAGNHALSIKRVLTDGTAQTSFSTYDSFGYQTSASDPLGRVIRFAYDSRGNRVTILRPDGTTLTNIYDLQDRILASTDAGGQTTRFEYDPANNLSTLIDAKGNVYRFTYDGAHRKTGMIYPDGSRETWTYNLLGQLVRYSNRAQQIKSIEYNTAGQPKSETWSPAGVANDIIYEYDDGGRLATANTSETKLSYTYDALGRLISETSDLRALAPEVRPAEVRYSYDALGRRQSLTYPDGTKVIYTYDARGRLNFISDRTRGQPLATYNYDSLGRVNQLSRENDMISRFTFDAAGQITDLVHAKGDQVLASSHYQLDSFGRRTVQTREDKISETYTYDPTGQLTAVDYGRKKSESFTYDVTGNRLTSTGISSDGLSTNLSYRANDLNQYTAVQSLASTTDVSFSYDQSGNLLEDGKQHYVYDARSRLTRVESEATRAEFYYDARNRCVLRKYYAKGSQNQWNLSSSDTRVLTYDSSWNLLTEQNVDGLEVARYIFGSRIDETLRADLLDQRSSRLVSYYPVADGLNNTVALADKQGNVIQRYRYEVFGRPTILNADYSPASRSQQLGFRLLFTGREWLSAVGLSDHRNRYYNQSLGRWITPDPIGFRPYEKNLYRYVQNFVSGYLDALGLDVLVPYTFTSDGIFDLEIKGTIRVYCNPDGTASTAITGTTSDSWGIVGKIKAGDGEFSFGLGDSLNLTITQISSKCGSDGKTKFTFKVTVQVTNASMFGGQTRTKEIPVSGTLDCK